MDKKQDDDRACDKFRTREGCITPVRKQTKGHIGPEEPMLTHFARKIAHTSIDCVCVRGIATHLCLGVLATSLVKKQSTVAVV
jgi:hypothetical protein